MALRKEKLPDTHGRISFATRLRFNWNLTVEDPKTKTAYVFEVPNDGITDFSIGQYLIFSGTLKIDKSHAKKTGREAKLYYHRHGEVMKDWTCHMISDVTYRQGLDYKMVETCQNIITSAARLISDPNGMRFQEICEMMYRLDTIKSQLKIMADQSTPAHVVSIDIT